MEDIMFYDHNCHPVGTTSRALRVVSGIHRGRTQWYAESVPPDWRGDWRRPIRTVVVNLPRGVQALEGELWEVRQQEHQKVRGILFCDGVRKVANPEGVPDCIVAGARLVISDCPENDGLLLRRSGVVTGATVVKMPGITWLEIAFGDIRYEVTRQAGATLPRFPGNTVRVHNLHRFGTSWHATLNGKLVQLYGAK